MFCILSPSSKDYKIVAGINYLDLSLSLLVLVKIKLGDTSRGARCEDSCSERGRW